MGAVALTAVSIGLVLIVWRGDWPTSLDALRIDVLSKALLLSMSGALLVLVTLGFAITRRTIRFGPDGFEASGGTDDETTKA